MKYLFLSITILCIATACKHPNINCIRPYTAKEKIFIKNLEKSGVHVELDRFNYSYLDYGDSMEVCYGVIQDVYYVYISDEDFEVIANIDSMRVMSKMIVKELYNNVMTVEDIAYTHEIDVRINSRPIRKYQEVGNLYSARFKITDLEKHCGFHVESTANGFFRRKNSIQEQNLNIYKEYLFSDSLNLQKK